VNTIKLTMLRSRSQNLIYLARSLARFKPHLLKAAAALGMFPLATSCTDDNVAYQKAKQHVWGSLINGCDYERLTFFDDHYARYGSESLKKKLELMGINHVEGNEFISKIIGIHSDGEQSFIMNDDKGWSFKFSFENSGTVLREVERGKLGFRKQVQPGNEIMSGEFKICEGK
jgi:hypothetical protein